MFYLDKKKQTLYVEINLKFSSNLSDCEIFTDNKSSDEGDSTQHTF